MDGSVFPILENFLIKEGASNFLYSFLGSFRSKIENGEILVILAPVDGALHRLEISSNKPIRQIVSLIEGIDILNNHLSFKNLNMSNSGHPVYTAINDTTYGNTADDLNKLNYVASISIGNLFVAVIDSVIFLENQLIGIRDSDHRNSTTYESDSNSSSSDNNSSNSDNESQSDDDDDDDEYNDGVLRGEYGFFDKNKFSNKEMANELIEVAYVLNALDDKYKLYDWAIKWTGANKDSINKLQMYVLDILSMEKRYKGETNKSKKTAIAKDIVKRYWKDVSKWVRTFTEQMQSFSDTREALIIKHKTTIVDDLQYAVDKLCSVDTSQSYCDISDQNKSETTQIEETAPEKGPDGPKNIIVADKGQITKRERISLNELWESWCNSENPKHADSLFCAAGWGNPLALFVLRMRFTLPPNPDTHVLNMLKPMVKGIPAAESLVNSFLAKIDKRELFKWSDFSAFIQLIKKLPVLKNKTYDYISTNYGVSVKGGVTPWDAKKHRMDAEKALPNVQFPVTSEAGLDLDALYDQKCVSGPGSWNESLFCEVGMDDVAANYISRMKFTLPENRDNSIVRTLLESIKDSMRGTPDIPQTYTDVAVIGGINYQTRDIVRKMALGQLLSWDDLRSIFVVSAGLGLGFEGILSYDAQSIIIPRVNNAIKKLGLQIAE